MSPFGGILSRSLHSGSSSDNFNLFRRMRMGVVNPSRRVFQSSHAARINVSAAARIIFK